MKKRKVIFTAIVLFFGVGLIANDTYAVPKKLIGMWREIGSCEFISIQFRDNGTFTADRGMDNLFSNLEGTYEVHGRTITLTVNNDLRVPAVAPTIELISYKVRYEILSFTMNGNRCKFEKML